MPTWGSATLSFADKIDLRGGCSAFKVCTSEPDSVCRYSTPRTPHDAFPFLHLIASYRSLVNMEVVGGIAAVLQLVQAVGNTVIYVSQVYHDVRDMDDTLQDFDSQLDATRMMLSVLSDGIRRSALGQNTPPWWNQSALEGILNSYDRSYSRLGAIFVEIGRQRSSATALRAYIRKRRYDGDISHLRLSIDTYTSALQLPVLIQTIQG